MEFIIETEIDKLRFISDENLEDLDILKLEIDFNKDKEIIDWIYEKVKRSGIYPFSIPKLDDYRFILDKNNNEYILNNSYLNGTPVTKLILEIQKYAR